MFSTPRQPVKRRLNFTPYATPVVKRPKVASEGYRGTVVSNRHYGRGPSTYGSLQQQVKSLQRFVNTLKPEIKYLDIDLTKTNLSTTGYVIHLTAIGQNDNAQARTGDAIRVCSITLKGIWATGTVANGFFYRVLVVQDKQTIADTAPSASDVITSANPVTCLPNTSSLERFNVLYVSPLFAGIQMTNGAQTPYAQFTKTCDIKVSYNGIASTDQQKNALYVVLLTDDTNNIVDFAGIARIGFTDA